MQSNLILVLVIAIAVIFCLTSLLGGTFAVIRYAKTRKIAYLIIGLLQILIMPVLCLYTTLVLFIPSALLF